MSYRNKPRKNYKDIDITGQRYGRLVAIKKNPNTRSQWIFTCDCGNEISIPVSKVFYGQLSCGCMRKEVAQEWVKSHITHGESKTKLYRKYRSMLERCYGNNIEKTKRYKGRGIYVCDEWKNSFESFKKWAYEAGYNPNLDGNKEQSIERIDNNDGYTPDNCKWATTKEQQQNRECTKFYPFNGVMYNASEFADMFNIYDKSFVYRRLKQNKDLRQILDEWNIIHHTPDGLCTPKEYAEKHGIQPWTVKRWIRKGKLKGVKVGLFWYVKECD